MKMTSLSDLIPQNMACCDTHIVDLKTSYELFDAGYITYDPDASQTGFIINENMALDGSDTTYQDYVKDYCKVDNLAVNDILIMYGGSLAAIVIVVERTVSSESHRYFKDITDTFALRSFYNSFDSKSDYAQIEMSNPTLRIVPVIQFFYDELKELRNLIPTQEETQNQKFYCIVYYLRGDILCLFFV